MQVPTEVFTVGLPVVVTVLLGIIGLAQGLRREAVVSLSIMLAALIIQQWVTRERWVGDVEEALPFDLGTGWVQFTLSLVIMLLTVLFVGYLLGNRLVTTRPSAGSRLLGGVLGLMNGAALAGWLLRAAYEGFYGAQASSPLYQSPVSYGFMVWAGWSPVVMAVLGTIIGLVAPVRRAQVTVAEPSRATNWAPTSPSTAGHPASRVGTGVDTTLMPPPPAAPYGSASHAGTQVVAPSETPARAPSETTVLPVTAAPSVAPTSSSVPVRRSASGGGIETAPPAGDQTTERVPAQEQPREEQPMERSWLGGDAAVGGSTAETDDSPAGADQCRRCGTDLPPGAVFCTECGLRVGD